MFQLLTLFDGTVIAYTYMYIYMIIHITFFRHEIDGDKEHITMKLSLSQMKRPKKPKKPKVKQEYELVEDDEQYSDDKSGDDEFGKVTCT